MGVNANIGIRTRGYYPKGGGEVQFSVEPIKQLAPIELLDRGDIAHIRIRAFVSQLPVKIAEKMSAAAERTLRAALDQSAHPVRPRHHFPARTKLTEQPVYTIENVIEKDSFGFGSGIMCVNVHTSRWRVLTFV